MTDDLVKLFDCDETQLRKLVGEALARGALDPRLSRGVHLGHHEHVRAVERAGERVEQVPRSAVAVRLKRDHEPTAETARAIFAHCREHLAPYKRVRRLEFTDLPKTISGKIRRVELRDLEGDARRDGEFREDDFPELKS